MNIPSQSVMDQIKNFSIKIDILLNKLKNELLEK